MSQQELEAIIDSHEGEIEVATASLNSLVRELMATGAPIDTVAGTLADRLRQSLISDVVVMGLESSMDPQFSEVAKQIQTDLMQDGLVMPSTLTNFTRFFNEYLNVLIGATTMSNDRIVTQLFTELDLIVSILYPNEEAALVSAFASFNEPSVGKSLKSDDDEHLIFDEPSLLEFIEARRRDLFPTAVS